MGKSAWMGKALHTFRYILAVWLSALISLQALAAVAAPCSSLVEGSGSMAISMDDSSHHAHHAAADRAEAPEGSAGNCCDDAYCSQGGCLTLPAATSEVLASTVELARTAPAVISGSVPRHKPNRLFRPPSA